MPPKVSVLMPAFNSEMYIAEAIESVLEQTLTDFELLIGNDKSHDNTVEIASLYAKKDKRIKIINNPENVGIPTNRNLMIDAARGEYIAWQDSDDISVKTRLEKQSKFLDAHPEVGIVGGSLQFFNQQGLLTVRKYAADDASLRKTFFKFMPVAQPAAMVRKKVIVEAGKYNPNYFTAEDLDVLFRIARISKMANLQEVVLLYRKYETSSTVKRINELERNTLNIRYQYAKQRDFVPSFSDIMFNVAQLLSLNILPGKFRIQLFELLRNSKT